MPVHTKAREGTATIQPLRFRFQARSGICSMLFASVVACNNHLSNCAEESRKSMLMFTDFDSIENRNPGGAMMSPVITPIALSGNIVFLTRAPLVTPTLANGSPNRLVRIFASSSFALEPLFFELILVFGTSLSFIMNRITS